MTSAVAIVRSVPDSFSSAIVREPLGTIDVARARVQHEIYRNALGASGYRVQVVSADADHPDCPFVEDVAVVLDHVAIATRPGAPQRRGEVAAVAAVVGEYRPLVRIEAPGTLDGGDVLAVERTLYVGRSARTNAAGVSQLASVAADGGYRTVPVPVTGVLHLKSAVSLLDTATVLVAPGAVDRASFTGLRHIETAADEGGTASVVRLRDGRLLMTASAPATADVVAAAGFEVELIDVSEFQAADGGLTCLSILIDR